ncbi:MAG TPA: hypothetical protein VGH43_00350 [Jatrophihabitans sp.]|jgi:hypothetical protein
MSTVNLTASAGYAIEATRRDGTGVFARNITAEGESPWLVKCKHGASHGARRRSDGILRSVLADLANWCKDCKIESLQAALSEVRVQMTGVLALVDRMIGRD